MSNFLAVATVTAALQELLQRAVGDDVPGAKVTTDRPDAKRTAGDPIVNVFLYQAATNAALANADLPTRRASGSLVQRPRAAVDLHYLISFYGDDSELEPQRLLGSSLAALHAQPVISAELIDAVITNATASPGAVHPALALTDLPDAEPVRLCPHPLDLEQLSRVWSIMFQTPYALSISWQASVVLLERDETSAPAPAVLEPVLSVAPATAPRIERVAPAVPGTPVTIASSVVVLGSGLIADVVTVSVGPAELTPTRSTTSELEVDLASAPAGTLRAGTLAVRVVQQRLVGQPPVPRGEVGSNTVPLLLRPVVSATLAAGTLTVTTDVVVGMLQVVDVTLVDPATAAVAHRVSLADRSADGTTLTTPITGVAPGAYGVIVSIDGAASVPVRDTGGVITTPVVVVP